jgi:hypothetical protein
MLKNNLVEIGFLEAKYKTIRRQGFLQAKRDRLSTFVGLPLMLLARSADESTDRALDLAEQSPCARNRRAFGSVNGFLGRVLVNGEMARRVRFSNHYGILTKGPQRVYGLSQSPCDCRVS